MQKKEMSKEKLFKFKKVLFIALIGLVGLWFVSSLITIPRYLSPMQSFPWYTGIVVVTIIVAIPIIITAIAYFTITLKIRKQTK